MKTTLAFCLLVLHCSCHVASVSLIYYPRRPFPQNKAERDALLRQSLLKQLRFNSKLVAGGGPTRYNPQHFSNFRVNKSISSNSNADVDERLFESKKADSNYVLDKLFSKNKKSRVKYTTINVPHNKDSHNEPPKESYGPLEYMNGTNEDDTPGLPQEEVVESINNEMLIPIRNETQITTQEQVAISIPGDEMQDEIPDELCAELHGTIFASIFCLFIDNINLLTHEHMLTMMCEEMQGTIYAAIYCPTNEVIHKPKPKGIQISTEIDGGEIHSPIYEKILATLCKEMSATIYEVIYCPSHEENQIVTSQGSSQRPTEQIHRPPSEEILIPPPVEVQAKICKKMRDTIYKIIYCLTYEDTQNATTSSSEEIHKPTSEEIDVNLPMPDEMQKMLCKEMQGSKFEAFYCPSLFNESHVPALENSDVPTQEEVCQQIQGTIFEAIYCPMPEDTNKQMQQESHKLTPQMIQTKKMMCDQMNGTIFEPIFCSSSEYIQLPLPKGINNSTSEDIYVPSPEEIQKIMCEHVHGTVYEAIYCPPNVENHTPTNEEVYPPTYEDIYKPKPAYEDSSEDDMHTPKPGNINRPPFDNSSRPPYEHAEEIHKPPQHDIHRPTPENSQSTTSEETQSSTSEDNQSSSSEERIQSPLNDHTNKPSHKFTQKPPNEEPKGKPSQVEIPGTIVDISKEKNRLTIAETPSSTPERPTSEEQENDSPLEEEIQETPVEDVNKPSQEHTHKLPHEHTHKPPHGHTHRPPYSYEYTEERSNELFHWKPKQEIFKPPQEDIHRPSHEHTHRPPHQHTPRRPYDNSRRPWQGKTNKPNEERHTPPCEHNHRSSQEDSKQKQEQTSPILEDTPKYPITTTGKPKTKLYDPLKNFSLLKKFYNFGNVRIIVPVVDF